MPRGDGTGPMGAGPMTGRAAGYCAGYGIPGFTNQAVGGRGMGRGLGRGMARGRGYGMGFGYRNQAYVPVPYPVQAPVMSAEQEKAYLENEMAALKEEQEAMKKRLEELKTKK